MFFHSLDAGGVQPLGPTPSGPSARKDARPAGEGPSFESLLRSEVERGGAKPLTLSGHAIARLTGRGIHLSERDLSRLTEAVDRAAGKGSRDSLLIYKNVGYVVNIKNRTVTTLLDPARMASGVVTGIDSTVFVEDVREP
ncbi:MAG: hypothetical protein HY720_05330 [Planctomycetes bacterium]|nr:hypothetical protein [Planctomycetota bacterium]